MSISDEQKYIDYLRLKVDETEVGLFMTVVRACPGDHKTVQHRDRQPPWCPHCGRTDRGERIKHVDQ